MHYGLDFGTSNCTVGYSQKGQAQLVPLEGEEALLPSVLVAEREDIKVILPSEFEINGEVKKAVTSQRKKEKERLANYVRDLERAKAQGNDSKGYIQPSAPPPAMEESVIASQVTSAITRQAKQEAEERYERQNISSISMQSTVCIGQAAIRENIQHPGDGIFVKSPKTFLGTQLHPVFLGAFENVVTHFLAHLKKQADQHSKKTAQSVLLGRPVNYGLGDQAGNDQAIRTMIAAANRAGFQHVEFEYEPIAAALNFERTLTKTTKTLVVDIGGGTTDVTMILLSPDYKDMVCRKDHILASRGERVGGVDIDYNFTMSKLCRYFGKESFDEKGIIINRDSPIKNTVYSGLSTLTNLVQQREYLQAQDNIELQYQRASGDLRVGLGRLATIRRGEHHYRLNNSVEMAKKLLSEKSPITLPLKYVEKGFSVELKRDDLADAINRPVNTIRKLIDEVVLASGTTPETIYLTGGSTKSPVLIDEIFTPEERELLVYGDQLSSVGEGLVYASDLRFR